MSNTQTEHASATGTQGATRSDDRLRLTIICAFVALALGLLPIAGHQGPEMPGVTPFFVGCVLVSDLCTSFLLFVQFSEARRWSLLLLGCAYLYTGAMAVSHLLTFPGSILPGLIFLGTGQSAGWIFVFWVSGYAALTLTSILLEVCVGHRPLGAENVDRAIALSSAAVLATVACVTVGVTMPVPGLPAMVEGAIWTTADHAFTATSIVMLGAGVAIILLRLRRSDLYVWLSLALAAMLFANLISEVGGGRYTVGWFTARCVWIFSASVLLIFFIGQLARQQRLLAQANDTLELRVDERTAELKKTVGQRNLLLREVYHRVKNNLQIVDALIHMQARRFSDDTMRQSLSGLSNRVQTLGLVHEQLMSSNDLATIDIAPFLRTLSSNILGSLSSVDSGIALEVAVDSIEVDLNLANPLGLMVAELLMNAIKHACPGGRGAISLEFHRDLDKHALLSVSDSGCDAEAGRGRFIASAGVGSRIVHGLVRQLNGEMDVSHEGGMRVAIRMPLPKDG